MVDLAKHAINILRWCLAVCEDIRVEGMHVDSSRIRLVLICLPDKGTANKVEYPVRDIGAVIPEDGPSFFVMFSGVVLHVLVAVSCNDVHLILENPLVHGSCLFCHSTKRRGVVCVKYTHLPARLAATHCSAGVGSNVVSPGCAELKVNVFVIVKRTAIISSIMACS